MAKYYDKYIVYPISKLSPLNSLDLNTLIEVVVDDYGNNSFVNKHTSIRTVGDYLVSAHPIFNKIDDVYNDKTVTVYDQRLDEEIYRYNSHIYFSGQTFFDTNPYSKDKSKFEKLILNQTVQKKQLERYVHDVAFEIDPVGNDYRCIQYKDPFGWWTNSATDTNPTFNERTVEPFAQPAAECEFDRSHSYNKIFRTDEITFYRNTFATIIGKVKVPNFSTLPKPFVYYTPEKNLWAAVMCGSNIIAITELHNYDGDIAYFSMRLPVSFGQTIRIVVPFRPALPSPGDPQDTGLFANIKTNSVCVFYYAPNQSE